MTQTQAQSALIGFGFVQALVQLVVSVWWRR